MTDVRRGDVFVVDYGVGVGCEQQGIRPALVIQNDVGNEFSPTVIVAAITDAQKRYMPTHFPIRKDQGMDKDSVVMLEQIRTVDKQRLIRKVCSLPDETMKEMAATLLISLGVIDPPKPLRKGQRYVTSATYRKDQAESAAQ